jgi:hypothetical protein
MPGLGPGIHVLLAERKTWMAGTSPAMTWKVRPSLLKLLLRVDVNAIFSGLAALLRE